MNPLLTSWRGLPLWAKLITLPFIVSGVVTAGYIIFAAIVGIVAAISGAVGFFAGLFDETKRSLKNSRSSRVMHAEKA